MKRRQFLHSSAAIAAGAALAPQLIGGIPVYAKSPVGVLGSNFQENDSILIIIQLFGGNDGLNTVIPADDPNYYKIRPEIGVPKDKAKRYANTDFYLHPALVDNVYGGGFMNLLDTGRLAVVQGVGYENPNLSHFRSTDIFLSGLNGPDPNAKLTDGWIGRYFAKHLTNFPTEIPDHPLCVQIGGTLSLAFQSEKGDMGIALTDPDSFFKLGAGLAPDEQLLPGNNSYENEFNYIRTIALQSDKYSQVIKQTFDAGKNTINYSSAGLVQQFKLIARLISGGLKSKVFMCSMGGFDTHVQQQDVNLGGNHPNLLNTLANAICQFTGDAVNQGFANRVVGLTVSEFGRRPYENGSRGTDHGAASVQFVFGTRVLGGIYGKNPDLSNFDKNGDVVYQNDYRKVYADVLQTWFGAEKAEAREILQDNSVVALPVLQSPNGVVENLSDFPTQHLLITPNPSSGQATISFELPRNATVEISLSDIVGNTTKILFEGNLDAGLHQLPFELTSASGHYFCKVKFGDKYMVGNIVIER
ncbi:MAG: DUF1501 domain-containing protein [Ignavibacteria bacterium]|nr:DUF1501 domain-containing protein [Ignavibacteria bacterium]